MSVKGRHGYQDTAIGWIPTEWSISSFSSLLSTKPEYGANASAENYGGSDFIRYIRITDISDSGSLIDSGKKYLSPQIAKDYLLVENDILIARSGNTVGKSLVYRQQMGKCAFAGYLIRFRVGINLNHNFMAQYLHSDTYWAWVKSSVKVGAQPNINSQQYQSLLIPLPPIPEQQKLADILTAVDDKLEVITRQIAATQTLKQGLMQTLFSRGVGTQDANGRWVPHTEFKESELGEIPKNWLTSTVGAVCDVKGGKRLPKGESLTNENTGFPYIRVTDMHMGGVNAESILYIPAHLQPSIARYTISANDIFITVAGTLGIIGMIPKELDGANLTENANKLTNISIFRDYLFYVLCSDNIQEVIKRESTANAQPKLALTRIRDFEFPLPPPEEQVQIAEILKTSDTKLRILIDKNTHYQTLKRGLMQKLLTGEWRVKLDVTTGEQA
jgi:type I restriction enzyme S subunit